MTELDELVLDTVRAVAPSGDYVASLLDRVFEALEAREP
jgi:hypothetical protein